MSSLRVGNQKPRLYVEPPCRYSDGEDACTLAGAYGLEPDEWQRDVIGAWLGRNADDSFSARTCGLSVPRQNGKNALLEIRELYGLCVLGEHILHSAHEIRTAAQSFRRLTSFFENKDDFPELAEQLKCVRRTNGQEAIVLKNGGEIRFGSRSRGATRGFTFNLLVMDESQELTDEHMEAMVPTKSASSNPQVIYVGTPPKSTGRATVFGSIRDEILKGDKVASCWHEWSVEEIGDIYDISRAYEANPAMGIRIPEFNVRDEMSVLSREGFARERLGWWEPCNAATASFVDSEKWDACESVAGLGAGVDTFGIKFSADGAGVAICGCRKCGDRVRVELLSHEGTGSGTRWIEDFVISRADKLTKVAIDGQYGTQALIDRLAASGMIRRGVVVRPRVNEAIAANTTFLNSINERLIEHTGQQELTNSVVNCTKRNIGSDGGFGWKSTDTAYAEIVEAAALALWANNKTAARAERIVGVSF